MHREAILSLAFLPTPALQRSETIRSAPPHPSGMTLLDEYDGMHMNIAAVRAICFVCMRYVRFGLALATPRAASQNRCSVGD